MTPPNENLAAMADLNLLGIDHGEKRIGLAVRPKGQTLVLPLAIMPATPLPQALNRLRQIIKEREIHVVVVGLPLNEQNDQAQKVKKFTRKLRQGISGVRWKFIDETLTSQQAESDQRESGLKTPERGLDDRAATLILEAFLDLESKKQV